MALVLGHSQAKYLSKYIKQEFVTTLAFPGYTIKDFCKDDELREAFSFFSVIALVVGANDIRNSTADTILRDLQMLCKAIHSANPRATIVLTEILPRCENGFPGCRQSPQFLRNFNDTATAVNVRLRQILRKVPLVNFLEIPEFTTLSGPNKKMLSRDGLHLSFLGTATLATRIENALTDARTSMTTPTRTAQPATPAITANSYVSSPAKYKPRLYSQVVAATPAPSFTATPAPTATRATTTTKAIPAPSATRATTTTKATPAPSATRAKTTTKATHSPSATPATTTTKTTPSPSATPATTTMASSTPTDTPAITTTTAAAMASPATSTTTRKQRIGLSPRSKVYVIELKDKFILSTDSTGILKGGCNKPDDETTHEPTTVQSTSKPERLETSLTHMEALNKIVSRDENSVINSIPFRPKGGDLFIFSPGLCKEKCEDWKTDGYKWRNYGIKKKTCDTESGKHIIHKRFYKIVNGKEEDDQFQKQVFTFESNSDIKNFVLVIYYGDETVFKPAPHRNSKSKKPFISTKKSVIKAIQNEGDRNPVQVQNKVNAHFEQTTSAKETGFSTVRNIRQVKNIQSSMRNAKKLGHDSLYNLLQIYYNLENYISDITIAPDLHVTIGLQESIKEFDKLLQLKTEDSVCLYYDTTFNLGDFYVSTLSYKHFMFKEAPIIPIAHIIHERKFQRVHEIFFQYIKDKIPRLNKTNIPIVTDREQAIINAIQNIFPNITTLICWNHVIRDLKEWLRKKGEINENITVYVKQIKNLLQCSVEEEYVELLNSYRNIWSKLFVEHFDKSLDLQFRQSAVKWVVEKFSLYNPFSGITNNAAEANNARVKRLLDFKERDIDTIVLYLYYFQNIDVNNILKGLCNRGEYQLKSKYSYALIDAEDLDLNIALHPDTLIDLLRGKIANNETSDPASKTTKDKDRSNETKDETTNTKSNTLSQESLAAKVIADKGITLVPERGAFMIRGTKNKNYAVTIFPKESCQCPSTARCYHVISAMRSVGINTNTDNKRTISLSKLRKRSRKNNQKRIGRKKPRLGDIDLDQSIIIAAPDSILNATNENSLSETEPTTPKVVSSSTPKSILKTKCVTPLSNKSKKNLRFEKYNKTTDDSIADLNDYCSENQTPLPNKSRKNLKFEKKSNKITTDDSNADLNDSRSENNDSRSENNDSWDLNDVQTNPPKPVKKNKVLSENTWKPELHLLNSDRESILNDQKLTSTHIEAINILLRNQFGNKINGLQLPEKVPYFDDKLNRWHVSNVMEPVKPPACQIHHTHRDHWVVSFYDMDENIYLFDSLGTDRKLENIITHGLSIQLSLLYGNNKKVLKVIVPDTQKQADSINCGVFAIAHAVTFCMSGTITPNITYNTSEFRTHLVQCLENESIITFPLTKISMNLRKKKAPKVSEINNFCICNLPECVDDMVLCEKCEQWFHKYCVKVPINISKKDVAFTCGFC